MAKDPEPPSSEAPEDAPEATNGDVPPLASIPEAVRHTGDVDEFDVEVARGAQRAGELDDAGTPVVDEDELIQESEEAAAAFGAERRPAKRERAAAAPAAAPKRSLASRAVAFLQASWAELQRVQWPDRRQVAQATAVVLGFVAVAGLYLGAADWVAQKVVNFIL